MAQLPNTIDCTADTSSGDFEFKPLPDGDYLAHVIEDEMKTTKAGNGQYLELKFETLENPKGTWIFDRLNVVNPNAVAVEISERQLTALGKAAGLETLTDSSQLRGIPVIVQVKTEKSAEYGDKNVVVTYKPAKNGNSNATEGAAPWTAGEGVKTPF